MGCEVGESPGASTNNTNPLKTNHIQNPIDRFHDCCQKLSHMAAEKKLLSRKQITVKSQDHAGDLSKMWYVHWRQGGRTAKKYGKLAHIPTLKERRLALEALRQEWQAKVGTNTGDPILPKLRALMARLREERLWRKKTYQHNLSRINVFAEFIGERKVTTELIREFFAGWRKKKHPVTFNRYLTEFRRYFEAIGEGALFPTDLKIVRKAKAQSQPARWLQKHEMMLLNREIERRDPALWLAIRCMYNLALRPGELRMLQAQHVFIEEEVVQVPAHISKVNTERFARIPKSFLPDMAFVKDLRPDQYLFTSRLRPGKPVGKNHFTRHIRAIMDDLGFGEEYKPCYSFRHTAAMKGVKDGVPMEQMRRQYGHHSLDQFIQYIRQMGVQDLDDFAEKFSGI